MSLEEQIMTRLKDAMKAKDEDSLRGLRAIKAEIIKAKTEPGAGGQISEEGELKMLQKLVKQRKDSLEIYEKQNREDLAQKERSELAIIEQFLPKQMSEDELRTALQAIVSETGASSAADMGKVMGRATKAFAGKADGKMVANIVKELLNK
ncbi:GatB/YqeY domain-containing protein [Arachidicoccus soli]|uniref:GatB/YqeY domain-containing protein n=1 Tax=Arachidicoccus soli TaxID=2341117 RepID=A0A386HS50_9BACT|nr:GatB/YqeY domain-containing protein [Arachidicoccus soli]AYD48788.1 GatB/YqeY domain-containing protein [Arachidicoccus soli]